MGNIQPSHRDPDQRDRRPSKHRALGRARALGAEQRQSSGSAPHHSAPTPIQSPRVPRISSAPELNDVECTTQSSLLSPGGSAGSSPRSLQWCGQRRCDNCSGLCSTEKRVQLAEQAFCSSQCLYSYLFRCQDEHDLPDDAIDAYASCGDLSTASCQETSTPIQPPREYVARITSHA